MDGGVAVDGRLKVGPDDTPPGSAGSTASAARGRPRDWPRDWPLAVARALHRPDGLVEQTRWLFAVAAVLSLLSSLPKPLLTMPSTSLPLAVGGVAAVIVVWARRYLTRRDPLLLDVVESIAFLAMIVTYPVSVTVYIFAFAAVWFRALYGTRARVLRYCALLSIAALAAVPGSWAVYGGEIGTHLLSIGVPLPALWLTTLVATALARSLRAREQAQQLDAALVTLGRRLIGLTDRMAIHEEGRSCLMAICAATPGQRILTLLGEGADLGVHDHMGLRTRLPVTLPRSVLPAKPEVGRVHGLADGGVLAAHLGFPAGSAWVCLPMPQGIDGWLALGSPTGVAPDVVAVVQALTHQIGLALRTSDAHRELAAQALVDPLTGLANRSAFTAALEERRSRPDDRYAVLFLDLDDFKVINDGLGHAAGDELLCHIAGRLRASLRPQDVCARLGGDEFAILLPDVQDSAHAVAQRLVDLVAAPVSLNGRLVRVGASVGLAPGCPDVTADQLVQRADSAMYAAKARGKNRMQVFDASLLADDGCAVFELELAAAAGAGQLVVQYQPIVSVADGRPTAVEALVRWQHPSRGMLPPDEFIPLAERTGAIVGIGAYVLRQACAEAGAWVGPAGPLALHVNVSAAQLTEPGFQDVVRECMAEFGLATDQLVLEITESMVLDSPVIERALDDLIELGATIAIDDFGTGYSALTTLRTLPLDIVKIDRSFLAGCPTRAADEAVVEAIVEMAGRLGLRIVAEGVERVDQQQFLRRVGADSAQGYLHLPPTSAAGFAEWLAAQQADAVVLAADRTGRGPAEPGTRSTLTGVPEQRRRTG